MTRDSDPRTSFEPSVLAAFEKSPDSIRPILVKLAPVVAFVLEKSLDVAPHMQRGIAGSIELYKNLPHDVINGIYGLILCFYGGHFAVTIAAVEALRVSGTWEGLSRHLRTMWSNVDSAIKACKKDDEVDVDGDGVPDLKQLSQQALVHRKSMLLLKAINPTDVSLALTGLYTGWLAVLTTLKFNFARVVALGSSIGENIASPAEKLLIPPLRLVLKDNGVKEEWALVAVRYACRWIAITIAWYLQRIMTTVQSAVMGGLLFSRAMLSVANRKGYTQQYCGKELDPESTMIDEYVGWSVAALGVWVQFQGFPVMFPLNIGIFPFSLFEHFLKWMVAI